MRPSIHVPYRKVISVVLDGLFDEDELGYEDLDKDYFLQETAARFRKYLRENYWEGQKVTFYQTIHECFHGPDSSGYPNSYTVYLGLYPTMSAEMELKLEKLINDFSY